MKSNFIEIEEYRKPIPNTIHECEEEIKVLSEKIANGNVFKYTTEVERQAINDRIKACRDKIVELKRDGVKVTPVVGTSTIGERKTVVTSAASEGFDIVVG